MIGKPTASIVIITYNNLDYTRLCLDSIYKKTTDIAYEIIVVDNASEDETPKYLKEFAKVHPNVCIILNEENEGFARGNNLGVKNSSGEYIVFLNNDIVVTRDWLRGLTKQLQNPVVGMVGPVTNSSGNETRIKVDYNEIGGMEAFAQGYIQEHEGESFEVEMLPLHCAALRRSVYDEIGPLDENFGIGMFEDDDYAKRLKMGGYKLICVEDVFVHHWGSISFSKLDPTEYLRLFNANREYFENKWNVEWQLPRYRDELIDEQLMKLFDEKNWIAENLSRLEERYAESVANRERLQENLEVIREELRTLRFEFNNVIKDKDRLQVEITKKAAEISQLRNGLDLVEAELNEIYSSKAWALVYFLRRVRLFLVPLGSRREKAIRSVFSFFRPVKGTLKKYITWQPSYRSWYAYVFDRYKRARHSTYSSDFHSIRCLSVEGKVSIVLPVYNGERYLSESLDSILQQTYKKFEVIIVDDGSTDRTPEIIEDYVHKDDRITTFQQENQRLPAALTNGFKIADGEYLTWTSDDNRMKPEYLEKMVDCLQRNPEWDMIYANIDIIGEDGKVLKGSSWFEGYQSPPGSGHVNLPTDPAVLNIWPNNYINAAFMYRDRVKNLIGNYSSLRFGLEDYDYWMKINALMDLRHVDFSENVYDYRFHEHSLTSRDDELGITRNRAKLMVFDDFRRDFYQFPVLWHVSDLTRDGRLRKRINKWIKKAGHLKTSDLKNDTDEYRRYWFPTVNLVIVDELPDESMLVHNTNNFDINVLIVTRESNLSNIELDWDLNITTVKETFLPRPTGPEQGWLSIQKVPLLCSTIDTRVKIQCLSQLEAEIARQPAPVLKISIVVCTYKRGDLLRETLMSLIRQSFPQEDYEIIVVNNDPEDHSVDMLVQEMQAAYYNSSTDRIRLIVCPIKGLSFARNAGIAEARGEIVSFIDDDAIARMDWLENTWNCYQRQDNAGVIGGTIELDIPNPRPTWLKPGWEKFWSQFIPSRDEIYVAEHWWQFPWGANWSARREALLAIGGFRTNYGRKGKDFSGGEEIVAASLIKQIGYDVVIAPGSEVLHKPDPTRFTFNHVFKTIQGGKRVEYNLQRDLYIPMGLRFSNLIERGKYYTRKIRQSRSSNERIENILYLIGHTKIIFKYWLDVISRIYLSM